MAGQARKSRTRLPGASSSLEEFSWPQQYPRQRVQLGLEKSHGQMDPLSSDIVALLDGEGEQRIQAGPQAIAFSRKFHGAGDTS
jgi:hypothetical protein